VICSSTVSLGEAGWEGGSGGREALKLHSQTLCLFLTFIREHLPCDLTCYGNHIFKGHCACTDLEDRKILYENLCRIVLFLIPWRSFDISENFLNPRWWIQDDKALRHLRVI